MVEGWMVFVDQNACRMIESVFELPSGLNVLFPEG